MQDRQSVIRRLLEDRGVKIGHFCEVVGIPHYQFSRIESGTAEPTANYYAKAAIFLNLTEARLLEMMAEDAPLPAEVLA